jgi:hypothetical protein
LEISFSNDAEVGGVDPEQAFVVSPVMVQTKDQAIPRVVGAAIFHWAKMRRL